MNKQQSQSTQTEQEALEALADLLMAQDDKRGQPERGAVLVETSKALQDYLKMPTERTEQPS
jgi:hypothetical protein